MEIIHIILGKANPARMNGVNKVVDQLAARQHAAGNIVQVWGITANPVHDYPCRNYTTKLFKSRKNPFALCNALIDAIEAIDRDVVFHLHGGYVPAMHAVAAKLHACGLRFVFTPHGSYNTIARQRSSLRKKIYFWLFEKSLLRKAHKVHSLGQSEVDGLQEIFPNQKSVLIPYGFEMEKQPACQEPAGELIVGFCGRLDIYTKGLFELLEGFSIFHSQQPASRLWIIGDGAALPLLINKAKLLSLQDAVVFWGSKYGEEKFALLQQCNVFAAPSRNEGLPTAVLEAAALGIPCLVTESTNTGAAVRKYDAGEVITKTDPHLIAGGLQKICERLALHNQPLGQNARRMIEEAFNWKFILTQFDQLYES